ncbi:hypothetical protein BU23DRAFT_571970 [Bimuria novae-zelandiae CBS 107.79]|uniref:Uncharacterized protein n=1 Tax=Bimuria novae-zelandiae CBS 107.79 TaxID=1447943 RepID=A0A6A5UVR7_9PLEO|nr:hypothetical protein BU23DRAFT_571970 [Bimuria novae-zelandiae CBS 107.79]
MDGYQWRKAMKCDKGGYWEVYSAYSDFLRARLASSPNSALDFTIHTDYTRHPWKGYRGAQRIAYIERVYGSVDVVVRDFFDMELRGGYPDGVDHLRKLIRRGWDYR